jgi:hypothetical protein
MNNSKKYSAIFFLSLVVLLISYLTYKENLRFNMKAMNCGKKQPDEYADLVASLAAKPVYQNKTGTQSEPVTFKFNFDSDLMQDTTVFIYSFKASKIVYAGPYLQALVIQVGTDLLKDRGGDSLQIRFLDKTKLTSCTAVHESEPFWQAGKTVHMELLAARELNSIGLPVSFKVRIE